MRKEKGTEKKVKISFPIYFGLVAEKCQAYNLLLFQI